jgi:hypothetical protein
VSSRLIQAKVVRHHLKNKIDDENDVTNVQYKSNWNCHPE